jgi:hypothetical protein
MSNIIIDCLSSGSKISSKRVVTAIATILLVVCTISELYFKYTVSINTFNSIMYVIVGGLGMTASEKFSKKEEK